jgi:hypothetical protein
MAVVTILQMHIIRVQMPHDWVANSKRFGHHETRRTYETCMTERLEYEKRQIREVGHDGRKECGCEGRRKT